MTGAENVRRRNEKLDVGVESVTALRDQLADLSPDQVRERLDEALAFFRHEVAPHARAEERVFYREVSRVLGVELGERMVGEHRYIGSLVDDVSEIRHRIVIEGAVRADLYSALTALIDIVRAHLRLEDEVLQRMAGKLSESEIYFLYERMESAEYEAITELSVPRPAVPAQG
jgi:iron-sulfur cluster repair protein YtfE (RIC family)